MNPTIPGPTSPTRSACAAALLLLGTFAWAVHAEARIALAPWSGNLAFAGVRSTAGGVVSEQSGAPPGPGPWTRGLGANAYNDTTGHNASQFFQVGTSFNDSVFSVASGGSAFADGATASNRAGILVYVQFAVERTQTLESYPQFQAGTLGSSHTEVHLVNHMSKDLPVITLVPGDLATMRLAPGIYAYFYESSFGDELESGTSDAVSSQVAFREVPEPLVASHPQSVTTDAGQAATFSVASSPLAAERTASPQSITYQWRRRYQPLSNGERISGAQSPTLHIANVAVADTGVYDCVLNDGIVTEPSSLARLTVTGVLAAPAAAHVSGLELSAPCPSPFRSSTRVAFTLAREARVTLDVIDVAGRCVRSLLRDEPHAAGTRRVEWDGRDTSGDALPSGLYFVRLRAGSAQRVQRVVRIAP